MGTTVRDPVTSTYAPMPRRQRTRVEPSLRNASRSRPSFRKPIPADTRWYVVAQRVDPAVYAPYAYRIAEGRMSTPDADLHRPYEAPGKKAQLGDSGPTSPLPPLAELSKLEQRGEYLGLAAAFLQRGKSKDALDYVAQAGASARSDSDRAAISLFQGEPEKAL